MQPAPSQGTPEDRGVETGSGWGRAGTHPAEPPQPNKSRNPSVARESGTVSQVRQARAKAERELTTCEEGDSPSCPQRQAMGHEVTKG